VLARHADGGRDGVSPQIVIAVVLGILALIFILSNLGSVSVNFLFISFEFPAFLMFLLMLLAGAGLDRIFQWWWARRKAKTLPPPPPPS
jgi:uncharacterized integral membrane protein